MAAATTRIEEPTDVQRRIERSGALAQAIVLLAVVGATGIHMRWRPLDLLGALVPLLLGTAGFACLSMVLAGIRIRSFRIRGFPDGCRLARGDIDSCCGT